ncbi:MAG: LamG-like jellyroll fold domain-containing protein [Spirochaetia bacterium]|jgi:hypothetical protein
MVRKYSCAGALLVCLLLVAGQLDGLEKTIELGKEGLWSGALSFDGVSPVPGRWGFQDLALETGAYTPDSATELLLHFDSPVTTDATGAYTFANAGPVISNSAPAMGTGSAAFTGAKQGVSLHGQRNGMFDTGAVWGDFTIEFWLDPATLSDGESIVAWTGSARGPQGAGRLVSQSLRCFIRNRKLVWDFQNLFTLPTGESLPVTLMGTRQLLPRVWHHHMLSFDSRLGLLEYRLDGAPEAIAHVTDTGRETGSIAAPVIGQEYSGPLALGQGFTGFMDELRISRRLVDDPVLSRFLGKTGSATFQIQDLGFSGTRIARIEAVTTTPSDSAVEFFYQAADIWNGKKLLAGDDGWVPFIPGTDFADTLKARYIQLRVELFPDGTRTQSPRLSSLKIVYEPNIPPAPPAGLMATPGNGKVTLAWRTVNDLNVKGYMVYYGGSPHSYMGTGATQGDSPIDAGSATSLSIEGLVNGDLYYFSVVAYDASDPRQQSEFSTEVSARPSRIYK